MITGFAVTILYRFSDKEEFEQLSTFLVQNDGLFFAHIPGHQSPLSADSSNELSNQIQAIINPDKQLITIKFQRPGQDAINDISSFWDNLH